MYQKDRKTISQIACEAFRFAFTCRNLEAREKYLKNVLGEDGPRYVETLRRMATPEEAHLDITDIFGYKEISRQMAKLPTNVIAIRDKSGKPIPKIVDFGIMRTYPKKEEISSEGTNSDSEHLESIDDLNNFFATMYTWLTGKTPDQEKPKTR